MKLWLIKRPLETVRYDEYAAHVIAAESEAQVRSIANERAADEGEVWFAPDVSCVVIGYPAESVELGIVLSSFNAG